jgi:predicted nucleic acid-binding protein
MQLLSPLLAVGSTELLLGLQLFEDHPRLGSFDAVLAAAAIASGAEGLASSDRAFAAVRGVRHLDPADNFGGFLKL